MSFWRFLGGLMLFNWLFGSHHREDDHIGSMRHHNNHLYDDPSLGDFGGGSHGYGFDDFNHYDFTSGTSLWDDDDFLNPGSFDDDF